MQFTIPIFSNKTKTSNTSNIKMNEYLNIADTLVNKISWKPLYKRGTSFQNYKLVEVNNDRIEFTVSLQSTIFYLSFAIVGLLIVIFVLLGIAEGNRPLGFLGGLLFLSFGISGLKSSEMKIVLDREVCALWTGNKDPKRLLKPQKIKGYRSLKRLHSIQLIKKRVESSSRDQGEFTCYEINLIMSHGKRVNVLNHASKNSIKTQAKAISNLFNVPLWDASDIYSN